MVVRRRDTGEGPRGILKQSTKKPLHWHMFVRFLGNEQLKESKKIGAEWGNKIAAAMKKNSFRGKGKIKVRQRGLLIYMCLHACRRN